MINPPDRYYGYGCVDAYDAAIACSRGAVDNSGEINVADLTFLVNFIF